MILNKLNGMNHFLVILMAIPFACIGQETFNVKNLRNSSEDCKLTFMLGINSFYDEVNYLCNWCVYNDCNSYENNSINESSFEKIENAPRFPQCYLVDQEEARDCFQEQINIHIIKNFKYPEIAQEMGVQGRVYTSFIINKCGNIDDIKLSGPDQNLEKEALRIIRLLPTFIPGTLKNGRPVDVPFSIPITFRLN